MHEIWNESAKRWKDSAESWRQLALSTPDLRLANFATNKASECLQWANEDTARAKEFAR